MYERFLCRSSNDLWLLRSTSLSTLAHRCLTVLAEETVEGFLLANGELAGLDAGVVNTQDGVDVVERLGSDVCEFLDLRGDVLDLLVGESEVELFDTRLDGVPSSKTMTAN